jgi:hypothetical protein
MVNGLLRTEDSSDMCGGLNFLNCKGDYVQLVIIIQNSIYTSHTEFIFVFHMIHRIQGCDFPERGQSTGLCNLDEYILLETGI